LLLRHPAVIGLFEFNQAIGEYHKPAGRPAKGELHAVNLILFKHPKRRATGRNRNMLSIFPVEPISGSMTGISCKQAALAQINKQATSGSNLVMLAEIEHHGIQL